MEIGPDRPDRPDRPQRQAEAAEREAARKIEQASKRVEEANHEAELRIDSIKDQYIRSSEAERLRSDGLVEAQRTQGYERLRDVKRTQESELRRIRDEGDRELDQLDHHYRSTEYSTEKKGDEALRQLQAAHARAVEQESRQGRFDVDAAKTDHSQKVGELKENLRVEFEKSAEQARADREKIQESHAQATEQARERLQQNFQRTVAEHRDTLERLNSTASSELKNLRTDYSQRLDEFKDKQNDPFYRMVELDGELRETRDAFVLTARVPEHEQRNVTVSVRGGNQLVVAGFRRSDQRQEDAPGATRETQSYQSFSQTFPLNWPVDGRSLSREFKGGELVVTLPKKTVYEPPNSRRLNPGDVARARAERPDFPKDIPITEKARALDDSARDTRAEPKSPGSGTLS